jgi:hypothetical protein
VDEVSCCPIFGSCVARLGVSRDCTCEQNTAFVSVSTSKLACPAFEQGYVVATFVGFNNRTTASKIALSTHDAGSFLSFQHLRSVLAHHPHLVTSRAEHCKPCTAKENNPLQTGMERNTHSSAAFQSSMFFITDVIGPQGDWSLLTDL